MDEYGDLEGIVTLEDILEEIVGEFTSDFASNMPEISPQEDGSHVIDGSAVLRDINRAMRWELPTDGPKTLNGLMMEHLEMIPKGHVSFVIKDYLFETVKLSSTMIESSKVKLITATLETR